MAGLILWKNQEIDRLRRDMDRLIARLWDDFAPPFFPWTKREIPFIDLSETADSLVVTAEVPGMSAEDLDISITGDLLTISGEIRATGEEGNEGYRRRERMHGFFSRAIELPCKVVVDDVTATYKDGLLHIVMPKCRPSEPRETKIRVK